MSAGPDLSLVCVAALVDAWRDAWPTDGHQARWERHARELEARRPTIPRSGADPADVTAWDSLTQAALACRRHAQLFATHDADRALRETAEDIGRHADPDITRDDINLAIATEQLGRALEAGDHKVADELEAIIDRLAPPRTSTTRKAA